MKINRGVICMLAVVVFAASPTVSLAQRSGSHFGSGSSGSIGRAGGTAQQSGSHFGSGNSGSIGRASGTAQQSGSHFGIAQPPAAFAPTQAPATVTRTTFVANPSLTQAPVTVIQNPIVTPGPGFVPGQTFVPNPVSTPHPVFGSSRGFTPNPGFVSNQFALPVDSPLVPGMSREDVLRRFGQPLGSVATRTSETLVFDGGLKVTLENGRLTGAR